MASELSRAKDVMMSPEELSVSEHDRIVEVVAHAAAALFPHAVVDSKTPDSVDGRCPDVVVRSKTRRVRHVFEVETKVCVDDACREHWRAFGALGPLTIVVPATMVIDAFVVAAGVGLDCWIATYEVAMNGDVTLLFPSDA